MSGGKAAEKTAALQDASARYYALESAPAFGLRLSFLSFWRFLFPTTARNQTALQAIRAADLPLVSCVGAGLCDDHQTPSGAEPHARHSEPVPRARQCGIVSLVERPFRRK